jgi:hypothetical protein
MSDSAIEKINEQWLQDLQELTSRYQEAVKQLTEKARAEIKFIRANIKGDGPGRPGDIK